MKAALPSSDGYGRFSIDFGLDEKPWEAAGYRCDVAFDLPLWYHGSAEPAHLFLPGLEIDGAALRGVQSLVGAWIDLPLARLAVTPLAGVFRLIDLKFRKLSLEFDEKIIGSLGARRVGFSLRQLPFDAEFSLHIDQSCLRTFHEALQLATGPVH
jgi:hypothetical protein